MRRVTLSVTLALVAVCFLPIVSVAQGMKVGVVDMQRAIVQSVEGKKAEATFTGKLESYRKDIESKQQQLDTTQNKLKTQDRLLAADVKATLTKDVERLQTEITRGQEDAQKELDTMRTDLMKPIAEAAETALNAYAKQEGYTLIIDSSNPENTTIIAVNPAADITDTVIKLIDAEMAKNPPKKP
jgi:outer membrane protein